MRDRGKQCPECKEIIHPKARLCPYCQTRQPTWWPIIGGAAIVALFAIGMTVPKSDGRKATPEALSSPTSASDNTQTELPSLRDDYLTKAGMVVAAQQICVDAAAGWGAKFQAGDSIEAYLSASKGGEKCNEAGRALGSVTFGDQYAPGTAERLRVAIEGCVSGLTTRGEALRAIALAVRYEATWATVGAAQMNLERANQLDARCLKEMGDTARGAGIVDPLPPETRRRDIVINRATPTPEPKPDDAPTPYPYRDHETDNGY